MLTHVPSGAKLKPAGQAAQAGAEGEPIHWVVLLPTLTAVMLGPDALVVTVLITCMPQ